MHQLLGIVVPIKDNPTEKDAIESAESYAEDVVDQCSSYDYSQSHEETMKAWESDAKPFRTDTEAGKGRLGEIKEQWKGQQVKLMREVKELLEQPEDKFLNDWLSIYRTQRIGSKQESPLWGADFEYIDSLKSFDSIGQSWVVFLDFHS